MRPPTIRSDEGSAFVISIMALFVLSVLGLALMLTTTTAKDVAINHRWGQQAFFNADAALEYGKNVVASYALMSGGFESVLPPARADATVPNDGAEWMIGHPEGGGPCDPKVAGCRDYQYFYDRCIVPGVGPCTRVFIGRVLPRLDGTLAMHDFRAPEGVVGDLDNDGNRDIDGSFTLWVRRPLVGSRDYGSLPNENDRLVLTAEGTAPNGDGAGAGRAVSLRRLEMSIRLPSSGFEGVSKSDASNPDSTSEVTTEMASGITIQ